jgi:hypothetical protein
MDDATRLRRAQCWGVMQLDANGALRVELDEEYVQVRWLVGQATAQELAVCLADPHEATAYPPLRVQVAMSLVRYEAGNRV